MKHEIFSKDIGITYSQEQIEKTRLETIEFLLKEGRIFISEELNSIVEKIDFDTIKKILSEILHKSFDPENSELDETYNINFIPPENIYAAKSLKDENIEKLNRSTVAAYHPKLNIIMVDIEKSFNKEEKENFYRLLKFLIHEETHANSRTICYKNVQFEGDALKINEQSFSGFHIRQNEYLIGYDEQGDEELLEDKNINFYKAFNEGVTEKITDEIYKEYLKRTGIESKEKAVMKNNPVESYEDEMKLINNIIEAIAIKFDVSEITVWQALKKSYFEGLLLHKNEEVTEGLEKTFHSLLPNFVEHLAALTGDDKNILYTYIVTTLSTIVELERENFKKKFIEKHGEEHYNKVFK